jgi:hypothetical protein
VVAEVENSSSNIYNKSMIKSVNPVSVNVLNPSQENTIYINVTLDIRGNEYISEAKHFYEISGSQTIVHIGVEKYSHEQINYIYSTLKPVIENLPFTEQVQAGVELAALEFYNTSDYYGVPANTNGWELATPSTGSNP